MKTMNFILTVLLFSTVATANSETVKIYNKNPQYHMFINYQICFREFQNRKPFIDCLPPIQNTTVKKGENFVAIHLPEYTDYVRVICAYELDDQGMIIAKGAFPGEEDCKSFEYYPATLYEQTNYDPISGKEIKIKCEN